MLWNIKIQLFDKMRKAQVWVETAIYTLIGLTIIGIVLGIATPAINKYKDEAVIEQTAGALNDLNGKILETRTTTGNVRLASLRLKQGKLIIDGELDKITYVFEGSRFQYSEPGQTFKEGDITVLTETRGKNFDVYLSLSYNDWDIKSNGEDISRTLTSASVPYELSIEKTGNNEGKTIINIKQN